MSDHSFNKFFGSAKHETLFKRNSNMKNKID